MGETHRHHPKLFSWSPRVPSALTYQEMFVKWLDREGVQGEGFEQLLEDRNINKGNRVTCARYTKRQKGIGIR